MTKSIPEGWHNVTPRIVVHDAARLVEFLKQAFAATGDLRTDMPSVIKIGDSMVMVSSAGRAKTRVAHRVDSKADDKHVPAPETVAGSACRHGRERGDRVVQRVCQNSPLLIQAKFTCAQNQKRVR